jgi:hypothetical protein
MNRPIIRPSKTGVFPHLPTGIHDVALANMTQFEIIVARCPDRGVIGIGVVGKGSYVFGHGPHPCYVQEKLRVLPGDAENIADFIGDQINPKSPTDRPDRHGSYSVSMTTAGRFLHGFADGAGCHQDKAEELWKDFMPDELQQARHEIGGYDAGVAQGRVFSASMEGVL